MSTFFYAGNFLCNFESHIAFVQTTASQIFQWKEPWDIHQKLYILSTMQLVWARDSGYTRDQLRLLNQIHFLAILLGPTFVPTGHPDVGLVSRIQTLSGSARLFLMFRPCSWALFVRGILPRAPTNADDRPLVTASATRRPNGDFPRPLHPKNYLWVAISRNWAERNGTGVTERSFLSCTAQKKVAGHYISISKISLQMYTEKKIIIVMHTRKQVMHVTPQDAT